MTTAPGPDPQLDKLKASTGSWLRPDGGATPGDAEVLELVAPAVVGFIDGLPVAVRDTEGLWPAKVQLGAVMLAARLVRRRNSPAGIALFTAEGGAAYVSRQDPDVAQLLELGAAATPRIG